MERILFVLGTRPEIIKLWPVIKEFECRHAGFKTVHTNQHYSPNLDSIFFEQLGLKLPEFNLEVGSGSHGHQLALMFQRLEKVYLNFSPSCVVVQGDTNSVFAGAFMARRMGIPVAHVEAGLRSADFRMPEETNRILTDRISDYLFAPTDEAAAVLRSEGFHDETIHVTGNTIVDSVMLASEMNGNSRGREFGDYILLTLHRPENVDFRDTLLEIIRGIDRLARELNLPVVFPVHPRTEGRLNEFRIKLPERIKKIEAQGFFEFISLEKNARLILTDSGGVQEEACILGVPCVTVRISTERPETVAAGANRIAGVSEEGIVEAGREMMDREPGSWANPLGDGHAAGRIADVLLG